MVVAERPFCQYTYCIDVDFYLLEDFFFMYCARGCLLFVFLFFVFSFSLVMFFFFFSFRCYCHHGRFAFDFAI